MNTEAIKETDHVSWWKPVLFAALAGGMGWGIRGQYGHETGAMNAGVMVSLVLAYLLCGKTEHDDACTGGRDGNGRDGNRRIDDLWSDCGSYAQWQRRGECGCAALGTIGSVDQRRNLDRVLRGVSGDGDEWISLS